jgi:hypothetical protein
MTRSQSRTAVLGGDEDDQASDIAIDGAGNAYVTGFTDSTNFPTTTGAFQTTFGGVRDAFVTKLNPTGSALIYSTYLGGNNEDVGDRVAIDGAGNAYVTGATDSTNFPTTVGAFQTTLSGSRDAFVTKLNPTGNALVYSTYLAGNGGAIGRAIVVDSSGNAYLTGLAGTDFPTTPGAFQTTFGGTLDAFVTKLNPTGSTLVYSSYLGGSEHDESLGVAIDGGGNAYISGFTESTDFPTTTGAFQTTFGGVRDAFVTKLSPTGNALVYSTYLGGSGLDAGSNVVIDGEGNAYLSGVTNSTNFPTTPGAFQTIFAGIFDVFITKLNPTGSALLYSTYLGGSEEDNSFDIAIDVAGNAYLVGLTESTNFPITTEAFQTMLAGEEDAFVTKLNIPPTPTSTKRKSTSRNNALARNTNHTTIRGDISTVPHTSSISTSSWKPRHRAHHQHGSRWYRRHR